MPGDEQPEAPTLGRALAGRTGRDGAVEEQPTQVLRDALAAVGHHDHDVAGPFLAGHLDRRPAVRHRVVDELGEHQLQVPTVDQGRRRRCDPSVARDGCSAATASTASATITGVRRVVTAPLSNWNSSNMSRTSSTSRRALRSILPVTSNRVPSGKLFPTLHQQFGQAGDRRQRLGHLV